ncbi:hypothetical protein HDU99_000889 [Rhizoclosmatium hyalinum]|nr:hypothetical protein HDU99_000889 [Rhizoclosmatium hyalinum]
MTAGATAGTIEQSPHGKAEETHEEVHVEVKEEIEPELEKLLHTEPLKGLTTAEAKERLAQFGKNEIPEKRTNPILKFLSYFGGAISILLELAAIIAGYMQDWIDVGILIFVLLVNAIIGFGEEARAESALDALKGTLAQRCKSYRNHELQEVEADELVPGDIVALRLGDVVPADIRLLGINITGERSDAKLQIDQSALTGESLPVLKGEGDIAYSSSIVKQGQMLGVVVKTGLKTYIGRAAGLIAGAHDEGHFQKIINNIGNFLIVISVLMVGIILLFDIYSKKQPALEALRSVLILTIAAIPIGLPTVMSVTMAVGAQQLAKKKVNPSHRK